MISTSGIILKPHGHLRDDYFYSWICFPWKCLYLLQKVTNMSTRYKPVHDVYTCTSWLRYCSVNE